MKTERGQHEGRMATRICFAGGLLNLKSQISNYVSNIALEVVELILHFFPAANASAWPS